MRLLIAAAAMLSASPAFAQYNPAQDRTIELQAQMDMDRQRLNALQNETFAIESRLRTEQTIRNLEASREPLNVMSRPAVGAPRPLKPGPEFAEIPDAALADSNARIRASSR
jgi:hypothetical protein